MNTAILILLAAVQTAMREYDGEGARYRATFTYDDSTAMFPLTNPIGQPHYGATFTLERQLGPNAWLMIASNVTGTYTVNGCFEDSLESLFYAVARQTGRTPPLDVATIGKAIHFSDVTTNSVLGNVRFVTWTNVPPEFAGQTNPPSVVGYFILDWLLESTWQPDPSKTWDSLPHVDTNCFTSNLVARTIYRGVSNVVVLESWPITNILYRWHWPPKVYGN